MERYRTITLEQKGGAGAGWTRIGAGVSFSHLAMHVLIHWFATNANLLAILVTLGVGILLVCCVECTKCPRREKDELFKRG